MARSVIHPIRRRSQPRWWYVVMLCAMIALLAAMPGNTTAARPQDQQPSTGTVEPVPAARQAGKVAVLTVEGVIDRVTLYSLERRLEQALADGAEAIVIELNTPGGDAIATLDICHLIKHDAPANTIAWVNPNAYSAGSIIALACRDIVMAPNSRMGDAAPILATPAGLVPLPSAERAKQESPILAEVVDSARRNSYDENLVKSFVSVNIELWMLENTSTGERIFVDRDEYTEIFGREPIEKLAPIVVPQFDPNAPVVPFLPQWTQEDFRPIDQEDIERQVEQAQTRPPVRERLTSADADDWKAIMQVVAADQLLTMNQQEAIYFGIADRIISTDDELKAFFGATTLTRIGPTWSEGLVRFLLSFWVRVILVIIFLVGLFIELAAPGTGVFGLLAFVAIAVLLGTPYMIGASSWWPLAMVALGVLLVLMELFIIPGLGVAGIAGAASLLVGLVGAFTLGDVSAVGGQGDLLKSIGGTIMGLFVAGVAMWLISRHIYSVPMLERMILKTEVSGSDHGSSGGLLAAMGTTLHPEIQVGTEGACITDVRPTGRAEFDGKIIEVQCSVGYIERGTPVRVARITPFAVEVEAIES